ncbi:MAG: NAD(P)H-hydrate dehydratase [Candidatus Coproplasma sp.]
MQSCLKNQTMRNADKATIAGGVSGKELMFRAGKAVAYEAACAVKRLNAESVLIVCGTGNNGGDGYVAARLLISQGVPVKVYAAEGALSSDCLREKQAYAGEYAADIGGDIIVDCLFGTGLNRTVCGEYARIINGINAAKAYVISVDIPSGLNGDNGLKLGCAVKADKTVAIAYPKVGLYLNDGIDCSGEIIIKDIGINCDTPDAEIAEEEDIKKFFPKRLSNTHKGSYGSACVIAGSSWYLGASALAVSSALRTGCGYLYAVVPEEIKPSLAALYPQCIYCDKPYLNADAIAVGMGLGCSEKTYALVCDLLNGYKGKLIIDADGLNSLAKYGLQPLLNTCAQVLLTPHIGEMSRLCGMTADEVIADPVGIARRFAEEYSLTVHLKSASCITCDKDGSVITRRGNTALAKAGSGDMLAGLICGNAARGLKLFDAAVCSQYVLGCAAELSAKMFSDYASTSKEIIKNISFAVKRLTD